MFKRILIICLAGAICFALFSYRNNTAAVHYQNRVAVLEYHHIDPEESEYTITPERFREQLTALAAHHYQVISIEDFIGFLDHDKPVPPNAVVLTFDDGYESFYTYAYPELKKQGMKAANFVIIGDVGNQSAETAFLTWDQIKQMHADGFGFYSHTYDSHGFGEDDKGKQVSPLTNRLYLPDEKRMETEDEYRSRVKKDLAAAEKALREQLGNTLSLLCFPHGRYNDSLIELGNEEGITHFFSGDYGLNESGDKIVKRLTAGVPSLNGEELVDKINKETTLVGRAEDLLKNWILRFRYKYM